MLRQIFCVLFFLALGSLDKIAVRTSAVPSWIISWPPNTCPDKRPHLTAKRRKTKTKNKDKDKKQRRDEKQRQRQCGECQKQIFKAHISPRRETDVFFPNVDYIWNEPLLTQHFVLYYIHICCINIMYT